MIAVLAVLVIMLAWTALSGVLDRRGVTSALFLSAAGLGAGLLLPAAFEAPMDLSVAHLIAELALVLLLFGDATRIDLRALRHQLSWPSRLLLVGLPLTVLAGVGVGVLVFPGMAFASVVLLAIMLAPTDAALGRRVVEDAAVPSRVRQALDVESGLNDGLAVPLFLVALSIANAELDVSVPGAVLMNMWTQIGGGVLAGAGAAAVGGFVFTVAERRGWIETQWRQVLPLVTALLCFAIADALGGSGFIAAFVGGLVFGRLAGRARGDATVLTEEAGELLAAVTWIGFGALAVVLVLPRITWQVVLYALLSLTIVRMVPVAIALAGRSIRPQTIAFIGWFGPRGLASLVFALIVLEEGVPEGGTVLTTVVVTVALSILLHGLSSVPLVGAYHRWATARIEGDPQSAEGVPAALPRPRRSRAD